VKKKSKEKKITVGEQYLKVAYKEPESRDPIELQREIQKEYVENLTQTVLSFRKDNPRNFYIVQLTKRERLLENVLRNYFFCRYSCPTPEYDQSVFKYEHAIEAVEYLWTVPDKDTCEYLRDNALVVAPEEKELLMFVLSFYSGELLSLAKHLNGEKKGSPLID
jgi:hypothetical protein